MEVAIAIAGAVALVAAIRYFFKISWGWAIVVAVVLAKILSALGIGQ